MDTGGISSPTDGDATPKAVLGRAECSPGGWMWLPDLGPGGACGKTAVAGPMPVQKDSMEAGDPKILLRHFSLLCSLEGALARTHAAAGQPRAPAHFWVASKPCSKG